MNTIYYVIPDVRSKSDLIKESSNIGFLCPENTVLTGRWHSGDENGQTQYEYATLKVIDQNGSPIAAKIEVDDIKWEDVFIESSGVDFIALNNRVLVGRVHNGDENGYTKYATAVVKVNGIIAHTVDQIESEKIKESAGIWYITDAMRVLIGRVHKGDENGYTYYVSSKLQITPNVDDFKEPAPVGAMIVPDVNHVSTSQPESDSIFICPQGTLLAGRYHTGDENGQTMYQYSSLKAIDSQGKTILGLITIEDIKWEFGFKESEGHDFDASVNRVIVGRRHYGDENGITQYATGIVKFNGHPTYLSDYCISNLLKENDGWFRCGADQVITARHHYGDENGYTYYGMGKIYCQEKIFTYNLPIDVIVSLSAGDTFFPMNATDYIKLSRFRKHIGGGKPDEGYNKETNSFIQNNDQSDDYYDIPISVINKYYSTEKYKNLYNYRPHDPMALPGDGYFIQPFDHLYGDARPDGRVPAYVHKCEYTELDGTEVLFLDYWLFFGYNNSSLFSHEGDWEHLMVKLVDNRIEGAWLSSHTNFNYHPSETVFRSASELDIKVINGRQVLTVYCATGSHALYESPGTHGFDFVHGGYNWHISKMIKPLQNEFWKLFSGAWGEIGTTKQGTGPLGPWYKRFDFWYDTPQSLQELISRQDLIIVPNKYYITKAVSDSKNNKVFEAPGNMVLVGIKYIESNDTTWCLYSTLKVIDYNGVTILEGNIKIVDIEWKTSINYKNSVFQAPAGYVILGFQRNNDKIAFKVGRITYNDIPTTITRTSYPLQQYKEECGAFFRTSPYTLYIGRKVDSNDVISNFCGLVKVNTK